MLKRYKEELIIDSFYPDFMTVVALPISGSGNEDNPQTLVPQVVEIAPFVPNRLLSSGILMVSSHSEHRHVQAFSTEAGFDLNVPTGVRHTLHSLSSVSTTVSYSILLLFS